MFRPEHLSTCVAWRRRKSLVFSGLFFLALSGCAGRRPVADRNPPGTAPDSSISGRPGRDPTVGPGPPPRAGSRHSARRRNIPPTVDVNGYVEEGRASWYGVPFHGRRAANGEVYDMNKLTAAHRTLPFETVVRVTNLANGLSTVVRITDRGPFVENRIIDLSRAAADAIAMVRAGVEPVRLVVISGTNPTTGYFTVQVGAFHERERAERLRDRMRLKYSPVYIVKNSSPLGAFYRVHVGKISGEGDAYQFAEKLSIDEEGIVPFVVRLDDSTAEEKLDER